MSDLPWMFSLEAVRQSMLQDPEGKSFHYPLQHGTMKIGVYAPSKFDDQSPHSRDELYIIISGQGIFKKFEERRRFKPQDVFFVEAGVQHCFEEFTEDFSTWVVFWGAEGGELGGSRGSADID